MTSMHRSFCISFINSWDLSLSHGDDDSRNLFDSGIDCWLGSTNKALVAEEASFVHMISHEYALRDGLKEA